MVRGVLKSSDGSATKAVNSMLASLLKQQVLDAVVVDQMVPSGKSVFPSLVADAELLDADVFAPVLASSGAQVVSRLTKFQCFEKPVGVVLKACQMRALVELVKLNQIRLENVILIGVECPGTVSVNGFEAKKTSAVEAVKGGLDSRLRSACRVCKDPFPVSCDMVIGCFGVNFPNEVFVESLSEKGNEILQKVDGIIEGPVADHEKVVEQVRKNKDETRKKFVDEVANKGTDGLVEFFDSCINCHNCMSVCPICYCKECLYESSVFDAEAYKYMRRSKRKGALKLPSDTLLFQLGRMHHMILSCVQCGLCEQACPVGIPLMEVFIPGAVKAQEEFSYHPGIDLEEKIPTIVYREDEYQSIGEK